MFHIAMMTQIISSTEKHVLFLTEIMSMKILALYTGTHFGMKFVQYIE